MDEYRSTQTLYRRMRVKYIRGTIAALIDLLELPYKTLEKIPLSFFKSLKNSVEAELILERDSEREMAGIHISPNEPAAAAKTFSKNHFLINSKRRSSDEKADD